MRGTAEAGRAGRPHELEAVVRGDGDERLDGRAVGLGIKIVRRKQLQVVLEEFAFGLNGLHDGDRLALHAEKASKYKSSGGSLSPLLLLKLGSAGIRFHIWSWATN